VTITKRFGKEETMHHRIATLAALAIIGAGVLGIETLAVSRVARGTSAWLGSPEALAVGRAGRIAAESLGHSAADHAREIAFDATLGVVRGLSAIYAATGGKVREISVASPETRVRVIRMVGGPAVTSAGFDFEFDAATASPCCKQKKAAGRTTS
jgi:hypothetical protein